MLVMETGIVGTREEIVASLRRCKREYHLERGARHPILRLLASENKYRLENVREKIGEGLPEIEDLADMVLRAGHCFSVSDADMIMVDLRGRGSDIPDLEEVGIASGSSWTEQVAGTNGVQMAVSAGQTITVRGDQHYFNLFNPFACTSTPVLDATNKIIAVLTLSSLDKKSEGEHFFARHLLALYADRIQARLFVRHFKDNLVLSVHEADHPGNARRNALVSLDEHGTIVGATRRAAEVRGVDGAVHLIGQNVEDLLDAGLETMMTLPHRVVRVLGCHSYRRFFFAGGSKPVQNALRASSASGPRRLGPSLIKFALGSGQVEAVALKAQKLFQSNIPVLINGDSGTGKSMFARALHGGHAESDTRFFHVDCAVIGSDPDNQTRFMETLSDLRVETLRTVAKGVTALPTLYLARVDMLDVSAQKILVRFLFDAGRLRAENLHAPRILSSSGSGLAAKLRKDLYYRLRGGVVTLPRLAKRDHLERTVQLVANVLAEHIVEIDSAAMQALCAHRWPGNLRELNAVVSQALICGNGRTIFVIDLPDDVLANAKADKQPVRGFRNSTQEVRLISDMLQSTGWNISRAARELGIGRATIHRKIIKYGLSRGAQS